MDEDYILNIYIIDQLQSNVNVEIDLFEDGATDEKIQTKSVFIAAGSSKLFTIQLVTVHMFVEGGAKLMRDDTSVIKWNNTYLWVEFRTEFM